MGIKRRLERCDPRARGAIMRRLSQFPGLGGIKVPSEPLLYSRDYRVFELTDPTRETGRLGLLVGRGWVNWLIWSGMSSSANVSVVDIVDGIGNHNLRTTAVVVPKRLVGQGDLTVIASDDQWQLVRPTGALRHDGYSQIYHPRQFSFTDPGISGDSLRVTPQWCRDFEQTLSTMNQAVRIGSSVTRKDDELRAQVVAAVRKWTGIKGGRAPAGVPIYGVSSNPSINAGAFVGFDLDLDGRQTPFVILVMRGQEPILAQRLNGKQKFVVHAFSHYLIVPGGAQHNKALVDNGIPGVRTRDVGTTPEPLQIIDDRDNRSSLVTYMPDTSLQRGVPQSSPVTTVGGGAIRVDFPYPEPDPGSVLSRARL